MLDGEPRFHRRPQRKVKYRNLLFTVPRSTWHTSWDSMGRLKQRADKEKEKGTGEHGFIR